MRRPNKKRPSSQCGLAGIFALITWANSKLSGKSCQFGLKLGLAIYLSLVFYGCHLEAAEPVSTRFTAALETNALPTYNVQSYVIEGKTLLATNILIPLFSKHTGTNISVEEIVRAAADLELEYRNQGYPTMNIIIAQKRITNGIVTMGIFPGAIAQIVVSGNRYLVASNGVAVVMNPTATTPVLLQNAVGTATNAVPPANNLKTTPASPEEIARDRATLMKEMTDLTAKEKDTRIHVVSTNAGPRFEVQNYLVMGNSVLPPETIGKTLTNIDGAFGTNVSLDGIRAAATELQGAYRTRGYVTVAVGLPPQKLTNATVKMQVTEGRLAAIEVKGNHYFSSNNVMRALPSLHTNIILNGLIFQAELNQANANQDRQIYPILDPGPDPGTSDLTLKVKDRLPLHAKVELNNQSSPGTPGLRINSSAVYNNLWQLENSLGVQYGFSPELYKLGSQWNFYDQPLVANYGAFYRMPLGSPEAIEDVVARNPNSFGYDEATRKFNLPPASGQPELNFFASGSTIDTGLNGSNPNLIYNVPGVRTIGQEDVQEDLTVNYDLGARLSVPLESIGDFHSGISGGLDYKTYDLKSYKTNNFLFTEITVNQYGVPNPPVISTVASPVPTTHRALQYLPLSLRYDASLRDSMGMATFGLGVSGDAWYSGSVSNLQGITGSTKSRGHWVVLTPSFSHSFQFVTNWITTIRADGQWASEPLISNEQFGAGGVNSVRGYQEGQTFGDTGWHFTLEQQTPPHVVGSAFGNAPLIIRGSAYMDYARVYLLDPQGRPDNTALWSAGLGGVASVGPHWETRLLLSVPLLRVAGSALYQPFLNFSVTAQF